MFIMGGDMDSPEADSYESYRQSREAATLYHQVGGSFVLYTVVGRHALP